MEEDDREKSKVIHIKNWPEGDRPREKLLDKGPEALSDAALLAILLRTGGQGKDAVDLARDVLAEHGGIRGLMSATHEDLLKIKGIGRAKIAQILAAMEIVKRQLRQPLEHLNVIRNPDELIDYLKISMGNLSREELHVLHLNRSKHIIAEEVLSKDTIGFSAVSPHEIVEGALRKKASALILAHNHTTDLPMASDEDIELTRALVKACWTVDIPILDHIVVGKSGFLSMKRHYPDIFEGDDDVA